VIITGYIIGFIAGFFIGAFVMYRGAQHDAKEITSSASTNSAMADITRAFDDGFTAGGMGVVPKDIAWREWQRRQ